MDTEDANTRLHLLGRAEEAEELDEDEALDLTRTVPVGRVVYSRSALPAVRVVSFVLDGRDVVFRTREGAGFSTAVADAVVAFEVDRVDETTRAGWTVTLIGRCRPVTDPGERTRLGALGIGPWEPDGGEQFVRIATRIIAGRRIGPRRTGRG